MKKLNIVEDDIKTINDTDFTKPLVFHIGTTPPFVIDFLTKIAGVEWEEAWKMKKEEIIDGVKVSFIHIHHLKTNKLMVGRPKDHEDIRQLNRIEELRKK